MTDLIKLYNDLMTDYRTSDEDLVNEYLDKLYKIIVPDGWIANIDEKGLITGIEKIKDIWR